MQTFQKRELQSVSFDDAVMQAYVNCISAARLFESESKGANGLQTFESRPSEEAFSLGVDILQSMLEGAGWIDHPCKKQLEPAPTFEWGIIKRHAYDRGQDDSGMKENGVQPKTSFEKLAALTALLHRRGFFKERKIVDLGRI